MFLEKKLFLSILIVFVFLEILTNNKNHSQQTLRRRGRFFCFVYCSSTQLNACLKVSKWCLEVEIPFSGFESALFFNTIQFDLSRYQNSKLAN